jgi:uncharacterized protein (TIGR03435 family)
MRLALLAGALALPLSAQHFEVAVIRPTQAAEGAGTSFNVYEGGRIRIVNEPVKLLIRTAFRVQNSQIAGGPAWLETDRYDIEAKTGRPEKPAPPTLGPYLQDMLAERFHLKFHRELREQTVWVLVAAKGTVKLKEAADGDASAMNTTGGTKSSRLVAAATSMAMLAGYVGNRLGAIVLDKTGLAGTYDFALEWSPGLEPEATAPSLTTALREQLGLRLEQEKAPVEVLVIDSLERPTAN